PGNVHLYSHRAGMKPSMRLASMRVVMFALCAGAASAVAGVQSGAAMQVRGAEFGAAASPVAAAQSASSTYGLVGATIIDGTGAPPVADGVVVVRDGRIACVGARAACDVAGMESHDLGGRWIMPGIVDAHVHYSQTGWADGRPDALDMRERFPY